MTKRGRVSLAQVAALAYLLCAGGAPAQRAATPPVDADARDVLRVRKLVWQGAQSSVKTPEYRTTASKGVTTPGEWWQFTVEYDTRPDWINDLTFEYYVLGLGVVDGKKVYSLYTKRVVYTEIKEGRGHMATVFLRPHTVERYGPPVAVAVEIYHEGKLIGQETEVATKLSPLWWKDPNVVDSPLVVKREGYLLNRAQSPFALVDVDAYETIKQ